MNSSKVILHLHSRSLRIFYQLIKPVGLKQQRSYNTSSNTSSAIQSDSIDVPKILPWRNSATSILVAPAEGSALPAFLLITRSKQSHFGPGSVVFPGGVVADADSSTRWLELYKNTGLDLKEPKFMNDGAHKPFIYTYNVDKAVISPEVSLRITAVRETFEECGILLCTSLKKNSNRGENSIPYQFDELCDERELNRWQEKSRNNSEEFVNLCERLACVPDLKALGEWNNWLTPTTSPNTKSSRSRFDTIFYMTLLHQAPPVHIDAVEVTHSKWMTASSILKEHREGKCTLMPPQLYELSRLESIKNLSEMHRLLDKRKELGIERQYFVFKTAKDGFVLLMSGDDKYPEDPNFYEISPREVLSETLEEFRNSTKSFNRVEMRRDGSAGFYFSGCRYGHYYS